MPRKPFGLTLDVLSEDASPKPGRRRPAALSLGGGSDNGAAAKPARKGRPKLSLGVGGDGGGGAAPHIRGRAMAGRSGVGASDTMDPMEQSFLLTEHKFSKGGMVIGKGGVFFEKPGGAGGRGGGGGSAARRGGGGGGEESGASLGSASMSGHFGDGIDRLANSVNSDSTASGDSYTARAVKETLEVMEGTGSGVRGGGGGRSRSKSKGQPLKIDPSELSLREVVGRGATSRVQLALHKPSGRLIAVKIISLWDKSNRDALLSEIELLFKCNCPCLVKFCAFSLFSSLLRRITHHTHHAILSPRLSLINPPRSPPL